MVSAATLAVLRDDVAAYNLAAARGALLPFARFECQMAVGADAFEPAAMNGLGPRPLPAAICSMERAEATDLSCLATSSSLANSSRCLISSQLLRLPPSRSRFMRTSTKLPLS